MDDETTLRTAEKFLANPFTTLVMAIAGGVRYTVILHLIFVMISQDILLRGQEAALGSLYEHIGWGAVISTAIGILALISANRHINKHRGI